RSVEALVTRVSPSVVQIIATGYGTHERSPSTADLVLARRRSLGSGVIVDSEGYIVTNAHVVNGARRVQVLITGSRRDSSPIETRSNATGGMADVPIIEVTPNMDRLSDLVNPDTDVIQELGVVGLQIDDRVSSLLPDLRIASGVIVVAHAEGWRG